MLRPGGPSLNRHMNEALITLDNLSIGYNSQPVLSRISLSIARDSFTAMLGANGSGKSTLLKTLLGLLPPLAGRIGTFPSTGAPLVFGYVPQSIQFDPIYLLTGFEVALMGVYGRVRPGRFVPSIERALTRECLRAAGAEEFADKRFAELSGGQKQRVLIARALTTRLTSLCSTSRRRAWIPQRLMRYWISFRRSSRKGRSRSCSSRTTLLWCATCPASHLASPRQSGPRHRPRTAYAGTDGRDF